MTQIIKKNVALSVTFSILTLGLYGIYWKYILVKNNRALKNNNNNCIAETLCLIFVPFYSLYWWYTKGKSIKKQYLRHKLLPTGNGLLYSILAFFFLDIICMAIMQSDLNFLYTEFLFENHQVPFEEFGDFEAKINPHIKKSSTPLKIENEIVELHIKKSNVDYKPELDITPPHIKKSDVDFKPELDIVTPHIKKSQTDFKPEIDITTPHIKKSKNPFANFNPYFEASAENVVAVQNKLTKASMFLSMLYRLAITITLGIISSFPALVLIMFPVIPSHIILISSFMIFTLLFGFDAYHFSYSFHKLRDYFWGQLLPWIIYGSVAIGSYFVFKPLVYNIFLLPFRSLEIFNFKTIASIAFMIIFALILILFIGVIGTYIAKKKKLKNRL